MNRDSVINQAKALIIDAARPSRIWVYGSEADASSSPTSDIDLAYWRDKDENSFELLEQIKDKAAEIDSLLKVDISDLSMCEERFINRVRSTGKILYSATKELRAEDALCNFARSQKRFEEAVASPLRYEHDEIYMGMMVDVLVKRFEFTFEMCWKAIKRMLAYKGIDARNPRDCFKEAYQQGWLPDEHTVLSMLEMRNTTAHTYDLSSAREILQLAPGYNKTFSYIYQALSKALV